MKNQGNYSQITVDTCVECGNRKSVVVNYRRGTPVLARCSSCWPTQYAEFADRQKTAWLNGENITCI